LSEEACAGKPQAGFCEGEAYNGARLNLVALSIPKGESNGEYKASLNIGGVLPTRRPTDCPFDDPEFETAFGFSGLFNFELKLHRDFTDFKAEGFVLAGEDGVNEFRAEGCDRGFEVNAFWVQVRGGTHQI